MNGENHSMLKPFRPKTARKLRHRWRRDQRLSVSFFNCSILVSSFQIACICTTNMIKVKIAKRRPSNATQINRMILIGAVADVVEECSPFLFRLIFEFFWWSIRLFDSDKAADEEIDDEFGSITDTSFDRSRSVS